MSLNQYIFKGTFGGFFGLFFFWLNVMNCIYFSPVDFY